MLLSLFMLIINNSEQNKMSSSNLSIIFAPNILRAQQQSVQQNLAEAPVVNSLTRMIIDSAADVIQALQQTRQQQQQQQQQ
jgi:hypothetical protein